METFEIDGNTYKVLESRSVPVRVQNEDGIFEVAHMEGPISLTLVEPSKAWLTRIHAEQESSAADAHAAEVASAKRLLALANDN